MTESTKGKLVCLLVGHDWCGGAYYFDETHLHDYDLKMCGRCGRNKVFVE